MTLGLAAMLVGAFGVPAALLWTGHRLRMRSPRRQAAFWGALAGHVVAVPVATAAALLPPAEWAPTDALRGALGFWLLLHGPAPGADDGVLVAAALRRPGRPT